MGKYWRYLRTVLRHKRLVLEAGRERRVPLWRLVVHDWSKFLPWEFLPYAEWFEGTDPDGTKWFRSDHRADTESGQQKAEKKRAFMRAFLFHLHLNPHHHQYWRLPSHGDKPGQVFAMPGVYVREMLADWDGAGRGYQGANADTAAWYRAQTDIELHPDTRALVERLL